MYHKPVLIYCIFYLVKAVDIKDLTVTGTVVALESYCSLVVYKSDPFVINEKSTNGSYMYRLRWILLYRSRWIPGSVTLPFPFHLFHITNPMKDGFVEVICCLIYMNVFLLQKHTSKRLPLEWVCLSGILLTVNSDNYFKMLLKMN